MLVFVQRIVNADQNLFGVQATTQYPDVLMLVIWRTAYPRSAAPVVSVSVIHIWNIAPVALKREDTVLRMEIFRSENGLLKMEVLW